MAIEVRLPVLLRKYVGGQRVVYASGATVADLLADLEQRHPGIGADITGPDGALHRFINIYRNDEDIRYLQGLGTPVQEGDVLSILPAVAGGAGGCRRAVR